MGFDCDLGVGLNGVKREQGNDTDRTGLNELNSGRGQLNLPSRNTFLFLKRITARWSSRCCHFLRQVSGLDSGCGQLEAQGFMLVVL